MCLKKWIKKMAVLDHFLFNSDYPTDKIVWAKQDTITMKSGGASNPTYVFVNTGVKTQLYCEGDFTIGNSDTVYPMIAQSGTSPLIMADAMAVMINGECWIRAAFVDFYESYVGQTIRFKLWAYCDENEAKNTNIGQTANLFKPKMVIDSGENYPKFIGSGFMSYGQSYYHNLGYIPVVKTWKRSKIVIESGVTSDAYSSSGMGFLGTPNTSSYSIDELIQIYSDRIKTYSDASQTYYDGIYYRIYAL